MLVSVPVSARGLLAVMPAGARRLLAGVLAVMTAGMTAGMTASNASEWESSLMGIIINVRYYRILLNLVP